jgi:hypothetical protein
LNYLSLRPILTSMITLIAIAAPVAILGAIDVLAMKFGAETRHGFDERTPIR